MNAFHDERMPDAFLDRIRASQSASRRSVNEVMAGMMSAYLPTRYDGQLETEIDWLLDTMLIELGAQRGAAPLARQMRGGRALVVTGQAGAGKSRALARAFETRPEFSGFGSPGCPLLSVVAPSPFTLGSLGNEIARRLGYESRRPMRQNEVWPLVRGLMRESGVRILHVDEAQHGDQIANPLAAQEIENTLKRMMQEADGPIWLILSGLPELSRFCQDDASMKRRVRIVHFESLRFPDHADAVRRLIRDVVALCPSVSCGQVQSDEFAHRLLHAAMWQFGVAVEYVQDAVAECLHGGGGELDAGHFADVYAARTGSVDDGMNVLVADDWLSITVETALYEVGSGAPSGSRRGRPKGSRKKRMKR